MRWLACREIGCCDRSLLPQSFENDDNLYRQCQKFVESLGTQKMRFSLIEFVLHD
jgi:hypothetical protein